jgi:hypothetical protein
MVILGMIYSCVDHIIHGIYQPNKGKKLAECPGFATDEVFLGWNLCSSLFARKHRDVHPPREKRMKVIKLFQVFAGFNIVRGGTSILSAK